MRDVRRLAQRNPTLFIAGSIAVGFGLSRFAKASGQRALHGSSDGQRYGHHGSRESDDARRAAPSHMRRDGSGGESGFTGSLGGNLDPYGTAQPARRADLGVAAPRTGTGAGSASGATGSSRAATSPTGDSSFSDSASGSLGSNRNSPTADGRDASRGFGANSPTREGGDRKGGQP
jgi:hypothetical protein